MASQIRRMLSAAASLVCHLLFLLGPNDTPDKLWNLYSLPSSRGWIRNICARSCVRFCIIESKSTGRRVEQERCRLDRRTARKSTVLKAGSIRVPKGLLRRKKIGCFFCNKVAIASDNHDFDIHFLPRAPTMPELRDGDASCTRPSCSRLASETSSQAFPAASVASMQPYSCPNGLRIHAVPSKSRQHTLLTQR